MSSITPGETGRRLLAIPDQLAALEAQVARLRSAQLALIAELDRGLPTLEFPDQAREEISLACKVPFGEAQHRLETARALVAPRAGDEPRLRATAQALATGRIGLPHAHRLVEATAALDEASARWVEVQVLGDDRARTPGQVGHRARAAALRVGADRAGRAAAEQARRELTAWESAGRVCFSWSMPALDAALVQRWVDAVATRQGPDDVRLAAQRRGDALFTLVRDALAGHRSTGASEPAAQRPTGRVPVRLEVIATHESLLDPRAGRHSSTAHGIEGRSVFGDQLRQLGCDADLRVTLITPTGSILDQGRTTRIVSTRLRGLLDLRDQHCRFPGCPAPAHRCEAHHIRHWADGGATDLHNLALVCLRHHHAVHHGGWTIDPHPDGTLTWASPAGQHVRDRAELATLPLTPPPPGPDDDHPPGAWIRPAWDFFRSEPPVGATGPPAPAVGLSRQPVGAGQSSGGTAR